MLKVWITHFDQNKRPTTKTIGSFFEPILYHMQRFTCSRGSQRSFGIALCVLPPRSWPTAHSPARRNRLGWERQEKNGHITKYKLANPNNTYSLLFAFHLLFSCPFLLTTQPAPVRCVGGITFATAHGLQSWFIFFWQCEHVNQSSCRAGLVFAEWCYIY